MTRVNDNSVNPDQTPRPVASNLGLHCLSITILGFDSTTKTDTQSIQIFNVAGQQSHMGATPVMLR